MAHLSRHFGKLWPVKVQAADHVPLVLQQPHGVPRAEVNVIQKDHAVCRPHGLALGAPARQAPCCQPPVCNLRREVWTHTLRSARCHANFLRGRTNALQDSAARLIASTA